ncbi:hypothetical protein, partial [Microcoleus sp. herbarium14]|uniref:hypothetical protein n=1 Tax=Microcoleus sp. herbarium14 TaxID=3055439 RepID=UPI002FD3A405
MWVLIVSLHLMTVPSAAEAMNFIKEDIKPVIEFSMDWAMTILRTVFKEGCDAFGKQRLRNTA